MLVLFLCLSLFYKHKFVTQLIPKMKDLILDLVLTLTRV